MEKVLHKINDIRNSVNEISSFSGIDSTIDYNIRIYLLAEIDTLQNILYLIEKYAYKECFILTRTVLEKFLFFWLMLEGRKYRWTYWYDIEPKISKTKKIARDKTFELWKKLQEREDKRFKHVINIEAPPKKEGKIIVTYEYEGLFEKSEIQKSDIIPIYNFILEDYKPEVAHLSNITSITECTIPSDTIQLQGRFQKILYHNFIYFDSILRNLRLNDMINKSQENMIRIHYNYLSKYTHIAIDNIGIWQTFNESYSDVQQHLNELSLLYVVKLTYLYLHVFVSHYKKYSNRISCTKYENLIESLKRLSSDLWLFETEASEVDTEVPNQMKLQMRQLNLQAPDDIILWNNPLERLRYVRRFRISSLEY